MAVVSPEVAIHMLSLSTGAWQPIDTAPSRGQILIGWHSPTEPDGLDDIDIADAMTPDSYWNGNGNLVRREPGRSWPTHWLPIPSLKP
jgi:hypothetical protein